MKREVVDPQRYPAPPHPGELVGPARGLGLTDRADTPRAIARRSETLGGDGNRFAVDAKFSIERADAREARRVEQDAVAVAANVLRFRDRPVFRPVDDIETDAVVVGVADQAEFVERFDHLDAVRTDLLRLLVVGPGARHAHGPLPVA